MFTICDRREGWSLAEGLGYGRKFSELLRSWRQRSGLSQARLADLSGLAVRTIRNWESGRIQHPHPDSARMLADGLRLKGDERAEFERAAAGILRLEPEPALAAPPEPPRQ